MSSSEPRLSRAGCRYAIFHQAAGYAGLISVLAVPAPFALILGILAVLDMKKHPEKHGMGRAVFAIIAGGIFTILWGGIVIKFITVSKGVY